MKKGFTMIELIFVIVILGILAAVAIPRLTATRDDASAAAMITALSQSTTEMASLYLASGKAKTADEVKADIQSYSKDLQDCVDLSFATIDGTTVTVSGDPADYVKITKTSGGNEISVCRALYSIPSFIEKYQNGEVTHEIKNGLVTKKPTPAPLNDESGLIKIGGTSLYGEVVEDATEEVGE